MKLGFVNSRTNHHQIMRDLSPSEIENHERLGAFVIEARNRLSLFRMLARNYAEWRKYLNSMLSIPGPEGDTMEELNRLLLNYLGTAYTIHQHFRGLFRKKFRHDKKLQGAHMEFIEKLSAKHWQFGFVLDYRGYVQHTGLAVGNYRRTPKSASIEIAITTHSAELVEKGRDDDWKFSKIKADHGEIDLIAAVENFQRIASEHYGKFVANQFFPDLIEADKFYGALLQEVRAKDPDATMVFFKKAFEKTQEDSATISYHMEYSEVPNDVFREVGIVVKR